MFENNLRVGVDKTLFKLSLAFDTSILHVLKVLGHVFHLVSEN